MTDIERGATKGTWLFYDGDCRFCISLAHRCTPLLRRLGIQLAPMQAPWVPEALGLAPDEPLTEMRLLLPDGQSPGGADAVIALARKTVLGWPLVAVSAIPGMKPLMRKVYRGIAARRHCLNGSCSFRLINTTRPRIPAWPWRWLPLTMLIIAVLCLRSQMPPWIFMWALAAALFFGFKWLTLMRGVGFAGKASLRRLAAYLFLWPGMDPRPFLTVNRAPCEYGILEKRFRMAALKFSIGTLLIFFSAHAFRLAPLARGWLGMLGIILFLHFGMFDLLALVFRKHGFAVKPIMRKPLAATSLSDFWSKRWNTAFSQFAHTVILSPLKRALGGRSATMAVFLVSGLLHELVISVPARAGYGLPTAYFLLQGIGVTIERSLFGRLLGLGESCRGRVFTVLVAGAPAFWLFHPPFIKNVILPMLDAIARIQML